jgi:DNA-binding PadR family transcriptional regulator
VTEVNAVNATAAALLGLLHDGPMTGGELVAAAGQRFGAFFSVTRSQVYRELPALAKAGLLRLGEQGPRASQQYVLTAAGKRAFKTWLTISEGADQLRSSLVLRVRHAGSLTARQRRALVSQGREAYLERLARAEEEAKLASDSDPYVRAVADFTVAHNRAVLALLDAVPSS